MPIYQYEGVHYDLPDGLSNDEAIGKIEAHLGKTPKQPEQGLLSKMGDVAMGAGEAGLQMASSIPAMVAGPLMGIQARTTGASPQEAEKIAGQQMENMTYTPRTEKGQEYSGAIGEFMNRYVMPVAPMLHGMPMIKASEATNALKSRFSLPKGDGVPSIASAEAALKAPEAAPEVPAAPNIPLTKEQQLAKTKADYQAALEAKLREQKLQQQSAFNRPEQLGNLPAEGAMSRMARDLGAEPGVTEAPLSRMVEDLTNKPMRAAEMDAANAKQKALEDAQTSLEKRQTELELAVKRQATLDSEASLRKHQEAASAVSEAHKAIEAERIKLEQLKEEARINADSERMGKAEQMEIDPTPFNDGTGDVPWSGNTSGVVPKDAFTRIDENGMPIRADLSLEAQQLQNPLQRNLWGDELPQKSEQEAPRGITLALDSMDNTTQAREGGKFVQGTPQSRAASLLSGTPPLGKVNRMAPMSSKSKMGRQRGALDLTIKKEGYGGLFKALSRLTDQPWFKEKFPADKYMTNGDGTPLVMLHGTQTPFAGEIKASREGIHAGFVSSPHIFTQNKIGKNAWGFSNPKHTAENANIRPLVIKKGNYPLLKFDVGMWTPKNMLSDARFREWFMYEAGKQDMSPTQVKSLFKYVEEGIGEKETNKRFTDALKHIGVDGFFYKNTAESPHRMKTSALTDRLIAEKNRKLSSIDTFQEPVNLAGHEARKKQLESVSQDPTSFVTWDENKIESVYSQREPEGKIPFNFRGQGGGVKLDWGSSKKSEGFSNIPGLKDKLRDIGNALIKSPQEAIELASKFGDVSQNAVQKGIGLLTKGGTYLKGKVDNPVVHYTVDRFLDAEAKARGEITQKLHGEYLSKLRGLTKDEYNGAFRLLNAADLSQRTITPEFMQQHGLSTKLQDFITTHQNMMGDVLGKINTAREAAGRKPITAREAYSAMSMSGDYRKVAYKTVDGVKTVVGVIGADRKAGRLGWTLEKIEKQMLAKDPTLEFGPMQDTTMTRGSAKGTPHEAFTDALETLGKDNPHIQQFLDTLREVAKDDSANYMGMQKHTLQKKGVWGMEGRKPWETDANNATQFFENQVKYAESAYKWSHIAEAAKDVNTVLRDDGVVKKQPNAIKMSEEYMQSALGLNPSRVGRAVNDTFNAVADAVGIGPSNLRSGVGLGRSMANTWMLSANPSFLAIQLIQGPAAMPAMTALLRGRGLAPKSTMLTQGLDHFAQAGITLMKGMIDPTSLKPVERGAIEYARKHHIYATDMVEHANQTEKGKGYYWTKVTQSPAALIESGTRAQVYMTFVKMMDESGLKVKDGLYEQAQRLTDQAMNNYSSMEKPKIYDALGPIGSLAYNLKSFGHNEISRWSMLAREIGATKNPVPLLTQMATTIAIAGAMGLPFYSQWETLYDFITNKIVGKPRSLTLDTIEASEKLTKELGDDWKFTLSHGLPSYLGADVSKRVGLGDVLPSKASDAAFAGGGKLADIVGTTAGVIAKPDEAHAKAAAMAWAPPIVASHLKDAWYTEGDKSLSMNPDKPTEATATLNNRDKMLKRWGITGINESFQKERNYRLGQIDKTIQQHRDSAMVAITYDLAHGKPLDDAMVEKYFVRGEGDPKTFESQINGAIQKLNLDPNQLAILQDSASRSVTRAMSLQRRMNHQ